MERIQKLLESNREWADELRAGDPQFFERLSESQNPDFLWIGCADSRISPTSSVGVMPGEIFVHRNIANLVNHSDMNCLAVLHYAVEVLEVRHVIVCGHYGCGGVKAAYDDSRHGLVDNWLRHIQDTMHKYQNELDTLPNRDAQVDRMCELNIVEQVINIGETTIVQDAWDRGQEVSVHGWIYRLDEGTYRDMQIGVSSLEELDAMRRDTYKREGGMQPVGGVPA